MEQEQLFKSKFATLLEAEHILSDAPQEDSNKIWDKINGLLFPNIPSKLFRFRTCSLDNIISFQRGTISTCVADAFEDSYDSLVYVNRKGIEQDIQTFANQGGFDALWRMYENGDIYQIFETLLGREQTEQRRLEDSLVSQEEKKRIFDNNISELLSILPIRIQQQIDYLRKNPFTKIACFTEDVNSLVMWDLYAGGYTGFALEYDFQTFHLKGCLNCSQMADTCTHVNKNYSNLFPVIYTDYRYDATNNIMNLVMRDLYKEIGTSKIQPPIDNLYWYKAYLYKDKKAYSHEKEWRMITRCPNQTNESRYATIPDLGCLKAIYYGPQIEERYKEFLSIIAKEKRLAQYDVSINNDSPTYELTIEPIQ